MTVSWDGFVFATHGAGAPTLQWNVESWELDGDGSTIRLEFVETGPADSLGMLLDAVSLIGPLCPNVE